MKIFTRFKIHGDKITARSAMVRDDAEFKESDHPRSKNGQFGSGGVGGKAAGKKIQNGVTAPKSNSPQGKVWAIMDKYKEEHGELPSKKELQDLAEAEGLNINQAPKYGAMYKKHHEGSEKEPKKEEPAQEPEPEPEPEPKQEPTPNTNADFGKAAKELGYSYEGNFNGIEYYKSGKQKLSYSEKSDTWMYKKDGQMLNVGSDLDLMKLTVPLAETPSNAQSAETPAPSPTPSPSSFASQSPTATHTAPTYAKAIPADKFSFSSKGISNEKGLPEGVQDSIHRYKGSYYQEINTAMRFSTDYSKVDKQTLSDILNIQRAFQMAPPTTKDCEVGRKFGVAALKAMAKDAGIEDLEHIIPGTILQEQAVCSTSHNTHTWSGDVVMRIAVPKGSMAIDLSETINQHEGETLLPPGTRFKINTIKKMNSYGDKWHIECEVM